MTLSGTLSFTYWAMRLRVAMLVGIGVAAMLSLSSSAAQTFRIERKDQGMLLTDRYPTRDFQIQLRLKLTQPGSVLDTVGIDAAPSGSWNIQASPDGSVVFGLWDGRTWSQVISNQKLVWGQEALVTIQRSAGSVMVLVNSGWSRKTLETTLSGKPVYVGDYPPDAHWGSGYNIHQAALGQVDVLYVGPPKLFTSSFNDYASRIRDERSVLNEADRQSLISTLQTLKEKKGMEVAVAFLNGKDSTEGGLALAAFSHYLRAEGKIPDAFAILAYIGPTLRMYHRSSSFDKIITWDDVNAIWTKHAKGEAQPQAMALTLSELAGVSLPIGKKDPVDTKTVSGPITEGKAPIGSEGGSVKAGSISVHVPPGALVNADTMVVKQGIGTIFGETGVSIEFEKSSPYLLKPATIEFPIPQGSDPAKLVAIRSLGPNSWVTMPVTIDSSRGVAIASTNHFCDAVLIDLGRTKAKFVGAVGGGVGGTILLTALGLAPTTSGASVLVAIPFLAIGWLAGGNAYDDAQRAGLEGPFPLPGFTMYWLPRLSQTGPYFSFLVDKTNGNLIGPARDSRKMGGQMFIGPADAAPRSTMTYKIGDRSYEVATSNIGEVKLPLSVVGAAGELDVARRFYEYLGITTPPNTTVYVHERLGKSDDSAKETNSGEWDGKVLQINSKSLNPEPPNSADSRAASSHEYWHAVSTHNGFPEMWPGAEEAIAISMESLVWATPKDTANPVLMEDFFSLHGWVTCTPVLRSGLFTVGANEQADTRGYKQWPLLKFVFHKFGKDALVEIIRGKMSEAKLNEAVAGLALAGVISDQVVSDPAPMEHPVLGASVSRTGFGRPSLIEDARASFVKFGETDLPKATKGSINAFNVSIPERQAGLPASPIVVRRKWIGKPHFVIPERIYASKPSSKSVPQPALSDMKTDESFVVLPEEWDTAGRMAVMFVGEVLHQLIPPPTPDLNPVLVYRLTPPTNVTFEHLPTVQDADGKTRFKWVLPDLGPGIDLRHAIGAYRLYGRKKGQGATLLAELVPVATHDSDWYQAPESASKMAYTATSFDLAIARSQVIGFDEFAMSSVDGYAKRDGKALESPIGWAGSSDLLKALDRCNNMLFSANLNFEGTTTTTRGNDPPEVKTTTYPLGASVNPPDAWGFGSGDYKAGKLTIKNGHVEFRFSGALKGEGRSADSLLEALNTFNPMWPFNAGSAFDGVTTIQFTADIAADGKLTSATLSVSHPQFGADMKFGNVLPSAVKIEGDTIQIGYTLAAAEATAKSSGHSTWMRWIYTNGSSEFRMTKFLGMRSITLNFVRR